MQVKVISLKSRPERREKFEKTNGEYLDNNWTWFDGIEGSQLNYEWLVKHGFDTNKDWRDPILKRTLTYGEIGCFLSHWHLWAETVTNDESSLILEDDVILHEIPQQDWEQEADIVYLSHLEMMPEGVVGNAPCYPYHTSAYIISPKAARILLESDIHEAIIPVDEFMPRMTDRIIVRAMDKAHQMPREESGCDTEPRTGEAHVKDFVVYNVTCFDDQKKARKLLETNSTVGNILTTEWKGGTMDGPGGGQKLIELRRYISSLEDHHIVIFTDAYDVFWLKNPADAISRYLEMNAEVVIAAEKQLWPDESLRFPPAPTQYRYLNSGCIIGRVGELKRILQGDIKDADDDQLFLQKQYLSGHFDIKLDHEQYIFQTDSELDRISAVLYHGNGGKEAKDRFESYYSSTFCNHEYSTLEVKSFDVIAPEMLLVDFLTPSQCEEWIELGEEHGGWSPDIDDKFPSHDIHFKLLGLWETNESWWRKEVKKVIENYWDPLEYLHLRKAFLMKYSEDTQKNLDKHLDASLITGSVKLNDNYEGATLVFPRQNITNAEIPIGKMILFPGTVTHGHYVDPLVSGTKYSATFWTARYEGDIYDS